MRPLHTLDARDLASLQMENELLAHEVRHLRARLAQSERASEKARAAGRKELAEKLKDMRVRFKQEKKLRRASDRENARLKRRLAKARAAEDDLRWLLNRLNDSPLGPFVRRRKGYLALTDKYGQQRERT